MSGLPWRRLFTRDAFMLLLTLSALGCVPLAARRLIPDAALTLLLPVTLIGLLGAWALSSLKGAARWQAAVFAAAGPFVLFVWVGQLAPVLAAAGRESALMLPQLFGWLREQAVLEPSAWVAAQALLFTQITGLEQRTGAWLLDALQGLPNSDLAPRAMLSSAGLWLMAVWAGWQIRRNERTLAGVIPFTLLLGLVLSSTVRQMGFLWVHLTALLLLLGVMSFENRLRNWELAGRDYVEAARLYALTSTVLITALLLWAAFLSSNTSLKDFLDRLREERRPRAAATVSGTPGAAEPGPNRNVTLLPAELLGPHRIGPGPQLSNDVVMVISTGELPKMPPQAAPDPTRYYWRTTVYETYTGGGWINPVSPVSDVPAGQMLIDALPQGYRSVRQHVYHPAGATGRLYWTNLLLSVDAPIQMEQHLPPASAPPQPDLLGTALLSAFGSTDRYTATSLRLEPAEAALREAASAYPAWIAQRYLALPDSIPERVLALARNLTASAPTPYDRARAIEGYLRRFPYTLDVPAPPGPRDAADFFLFDLKRGYCDYYATAMVVLSRAAGLPARFVTGYASGAYDPASASYIVTADNAHSWAEIYFPGAGWVEFEPTASQPLPYRRAGSQPPDASTRPIPPFQALLGRWLLSLEGFGRSLWPLAGVVLGLAILWSAADTLILARLRPSKVIRRIHQRLRRAARPVMGALPVSQTVQEYARHLSSRLCEFEAHQAFAGLLRPARAELGALTALYSDSLFRLEPLNGAQAREARRIWSRLRWRLYLVRLIAILERGSR
ncbi:MAG: transglutaminase-like domain-containing protein [Bacteroidota bacterium]